MNLIDTHLHLDSEAFENDCDTVLATSREAGVTRWINVGYNEERWNSTERLTLTVDGMFCMLGLHPGDADAWSDALMDRLQERVETLRAVAIGEAGIDLYWRQDNVSVQMSAFRAQLELAKRVDLPVVIHMRDADEVLLDVIDNERSLPPLHFHSFDGNESLREWVFDNDATIGVGGLLTRRGSEDLQRWLVAFPRDRVVLETDAPYLKPRGIRGKRNEPGYLLKTAKLLGDLWDMGLDEVGRITTGNAERIFRLPKEDR